MFKKALHSRMQMHPVRKEPGYYGGGVASRGDRVEPQILALDPQKNREAC